MNQQNTLSILLWLNKTRTNAQGLAPIWARITLAGRRTEISSGHYVASRYWSSEKGEVLKQCKESSAINNELIILKGDILRKFNTLSAAKEIVSVDDIKIAIKGHAPSGKTLMALFRQFIEKQTERSQVGELSAGRLVGFQSSKINVQLS